MENKFFGIQIHQNHDTISNTLTDLYTEYIQEKLNILNISIETYKAILIMTKQ